MPQLPVVSTTTNAYMWKERRAEWPPAVQLPAEAHGTECTPAMPRVLRVDVPGPSIAVPQLPLVSSTTYAWLCSEPSPYVPIAVQLTAVAHETESTSALLPLFRIV